MLLINLLKLQVQNTVQIYNNFLKPQSENSTTNKKDQIHGLLTNGCGSWI